MFSERINCLFVLFPPLNVSAASKKREVYFVKIPVEFVFTISQAVRVNENPPFYMNGPVILLVTEICETVRKRGYESTYRRT